MEETLARRLVDARAIGRRRLVYVYAREVASLLALVFAERRDAARRRRAAARAVREGSTMDRWMNELRHAARRLRRSPGFAMASTATLALGIGANAAIFAVVYGVVLRPLPYSESEQLIRLEHGIPRINLSSRGGLTPGLYHQYLEARTLQAVAIYRIGEITLTGRGNPERLRVASVTTTVSAVLRTAPALGRWFVEDEGVPGAVPAALISHGLWQRRFEGSPNTLGQTLTLDGVPNGIVGVMPAAFAFPESGIDVWVAERLARSAGFSLPFSYIGVARMREGVSLQEVRADLNRLIAELPDVYPGDLGVLGNTGPGGLTSVAVGLKEATVGHIERMLWILFGAVVLVLFVAVVNVANLFVVRIEARQREVAVRRALGAGRAGIATLFLAESAWLSAVGVAAGVGIAWMAVQLLVRFGPATLPRMDEIRIDGPAIALASVLGAVTALALGVMPLVRRTPLGDSLHEGGRGSTAGAARFRARHLLMAGQVAMALTLLVASGLIVRSFQSLRARNPGFNPASALTFRLTLPERDYPTRAAAAAGHQAVIDRLQAMPGVTAVSAATTLPLREGCLQNSVIVRGRPRAPGTTPPRARWCAVAGGFHEAMGIPLLRGRHLDRADVERGEPAVIVNQAFVDVVFPGIDPLGEHVRSNAPPPPGTPRNSAGEWMWDGAPPWLGVLGVVANTPTTALAEPSPVPTIYMPMSMAGGPDIPALAMLGPSVSGMSYVVRAETLPVGLMASVRAAIDDVDPNVALAEIRTLQDLLDAASAQMAFTMVLLAIAATMALLLGVIGIYGVTSYVVAQRTGEIGVRLALGARPEGIASMIVRQGGLAAVAGIGAGLTIAWAGSRALESLLFGVSARDPLTFGVMALLVLSVALGACWIPARRAARLNPVEALRAE